MNISVYFLTAFLYLKIFFSINLLSLRVYNFVFFFKHYIINIFLSIQIFQKHLYSFLDVFFLSAKYTLIDKFREWQYKLLMLLVVCICVYTLTLILWSLHVYQGFDHIRIIYFAICFYYLAIHYEYLFTCIYTYTYV